MESITWMTFVMQVFGSSQSHDTFATPRAATAVPLVTAHWDRRWSHSPCLGIQPVQNGSSSQSRAGLCSHCHFTGPLLPAQRLLLVGQTYPEQVVLVLYGLFIYFFPQLLEELLNLHCKDLPGSNQKAWVFLHCAVLDSLSLEIDLHLQEFQFFLRLQGSNMKKSIRKVGRQRGKIFWFCASSIWLIGSPRMAFQDLFFYSSDGDGFFQE